MIRLELAKLENEAPLIMSQVQEIIEEMRGLKPRQLRSEYYSIRKTISDFEGKVLGCNALSEQEFPVAQRYFDICDNLRRQTKQAYDGKIGRNL